jgi:folate-binding protein YgfZ
MDTSDAYFIGLDSEGVIALGGTGIAQFLQGQLTCDTRDLDPGQALRGAQCNPKGRVLAEFLIALPDAERCLLCLRRELVLEVAQSLDLYARFSRISCAPASDQWRLFGVSGEAAAAALVALGCELPEGRLASSDTPLGLCTNLGEQRWQLLVPIEESGTVREQLAEHLPEGEEGWWRAEELATGLYRLEPVDRGEYTPQALNYDHLGLVSFSKGCYTGQEVVARLHYRGQAKRRLAVLTASDAALELSPGAPVLDSEGSTVGELMRVTRARSGVPLLAAQLKREAPETGLHVGAAGVCRLDSPAGAP